MLKHLFHRKISYKAPGVKIGLDGIGVFSKMDFKPGELIEKAPLIVMDAREKELLRNSSLHHYYFLVSNSDVAIAMGLGYAALYQHSPDANSRYSIDLAFSTISIKASKKIEAGEEITINYNGKPNDVSPVYFSTSNHD